MTTITPVAPKYSHLTQKCLNYFPDTDVRIRENPVSMGAQLLNATAFQMENQQRKITRELRALNLSDMPMNIDNAGVYYASRVPLSFPLPADSQGALLPPVVIKGQLQTGNPIPFYLAWEVVLTSGITLVPYDDMLPVPTRVSQDSVINSVPFSNPQLINIIGDGNPKSFAPGVLPIPNCLTFSVQGMGTQNVAISVSITGELDPPAVWPQDVQSKNEILVVSDDGFFQTNSVWSSISDITITGLPAGCALICYSLPVGLPVESDTDRPFTHFAYRGIEFPRYWQLHDLLLLEVYRRNRFSGYETFQTYHLPTQMVDVAVEPNTGGLFLTDGTTLYYADRRTPMPDHLVETGVAQEPAYGLNVWHDYAYTGDTKYAFVSPVAMSQASTVTQYRYVVEDPTGTVLVLLPTGVLQTYSGTGGWTQGTPSAVSFPLTISGTYVISLETLGSFNAKTVDTVPFGNFDLKSLATINLGSLVPSIKGIAFDAYDKLWIWTGDFAIPVKISYDAFLWDPATRTIYATDKYSALFISNSNVVLPGQWNFPNPKESGTFLIGV